MKKSLLTILLISILLSLFAVGCGGLGKDTIAVVNKEEISLGEYKYYLLMAKNTIIASGGEDTQEYWQTTEIEGQNAGHVVKELALKNAIELTLMAQKAVEQGADNSSEMKKKQRQLFIDQSFEGNQEDYLARISELGLTDEDVTKVVMKDYLTSCLGESLNIQAPSDVRIKEYFVDNYYAAKHILVAFSNYETDETSGNAEAYNKITEAKEKLDGGQSFETVMEEYNEDMGMPENRVYIFTKDGMPITFENAVKNIEIGNISGIVESDFGFHIIKREKPENFYEYFLNSPSRVFEGATGKQEIEAYAKQAVFSSTIEQWKEKAEVKTNESLLETIQLINE